MKDIYIVNCCRTAVGSFGGSLKDVSAVEMGSIVVKEALKRSGVAPENVDEVIFGGVLTAGLGQNVARQVMVKAGIPYSVPAFTVNMVCGSGMKTVMEAARAILAGDADVIVAGGTESMSQAPFALPDERWGARMGDKKVVDTIVKDGLWDAYNNYHMGTTAESIAKLKGAFPVGPEGVEDEIVHTFEVTQVHEADAHKHVQRVTAANASGLNDGAAAIIVASGEAVEKYGLKPMAKLLGWGQGGVDPKIMGVGPVPASRNALKKAGLTMDDIDLVEANEAFAAQSVAVARELGFDMDKVNVNGGAIAIGHPIGCSGARIIVTLLHEMQKRPEAKKGLATLCIGGGMGVATVFEKC